MFNINCRVSGGVTGTREALLKSNGKVCFFDTEEEAQVEANRLNKKMNGPYATASFNYTVVPATGWDS
jgi:hypothetical protein